MYFKIKSTARMYMTGVIFSFFPAKRFITTKEITPMEIPSEML